MTRDQLRKIIYDEVKADVECEADADCPFQEGYAVGFNDCRHRALEAISRALGQSREPQEVVPPATPRTSRSD